MPSRLRSTTGNPKSRKKRRGDSSSAIPLGNLRRTSIPRSAGVLLGHMPERRELLWALDGRTSRSEEHTSELQSHSDLVCRLLLEKKKKINKTRNDRDICQAKQDSIVLLLMVIQA